MAGGRGSLVAETIAENQLDCRLLTRGVESTFFPYVGSAASLQEKAGLSLAALGLVDSHRNEMAATAP